MGNGTIDSPEPVVGLWLRTYEQKYRGLAEESEGALARLVLESILKQWAESAKQLAADNGTDEDVELFMIYGQNQEAAFGAVDLVLRTVGQACGTLRGPRDGD